MPVIVAEKRKAGIALAMERFQPDLIVLDDAFQHRAVRRNCDIILLDCSRPVRKEKLLPLGNLRERITNLKRASIVIFTKCESVSNEDMEFVKTYFKGECYHAKFDLFLGNLDRAKAAIAVAGIANPLRFRQQLQSKGIRILDLIQYKDHHNYKYQDVQYIKRKAEMLGTKLIVTTEKDFIKLKDYDFSDYELKTPQIDMRIENDKNLLSHIYKCIEIEV